MWLRQDNGQNPGLLTSGGLPEPKPVMLDLSGSRSNVNLTALPRSSSYLRSLTKCCGGKKKRLIFNHRARGHICKENGNSLVRSPWYPRVAHSAAPQTWTPTGPSAVSAPRLSSAEYPKSKLKQKPCETFNSGHQPPTSTSPTAATKSEKSPARCSLTWCHTNPPVLCRTWSKWSAIFQDVLQTDALKGNRWAV